MTRLFKVRIFWDDVNKAFNLDISKPNLYDRLQMQVMLAIPDDISLYDGQTLIDNEDALQASINRRLEAGETFLQLSAVPCDGEPETAPAQQETKPAYSQPVSTVSPNAKSAVSANKTQNDLCHECKHPLNGKKFCMNCGAKAQPLAQSQPQTQQSKKEEPKQSGDLCHECKHPLNGKKFCMNCGAKAQPVAQKPVTQPAPKKEEPKPQADLCHECQHPLNGKKFCTNCGAKAQPVSQPPKKEEPKPQADLCHECQHPLNGKKFCSNCGAKAQPQTQTQQPKKEEPKQEEKKDLCPYCKFDWGTAKFCTNCGHKRDQTLSQSNGNKAGNIQPPKTKEGDEEHCGRCGEIIGGGVKALGRVWHNKCFNCVLCGCEFKNGKGLMNHKGNPMCSDCYAENFGEKCDYCHRPLTANFVNVEGMHIHPECFCCTKCGVQIVTTYFKKAGKIVCQDCK